MSFLSNRINAFKVAFSGLFEGMKKETHLRMHFAAGLMVVFMALHFSVSKTEWFVLILCIGLVIALELVNSALEHMCDLLMPEQHPGIKHIKDLAAAAVLVAAISAAIVGLMVFIPYLLR